MAQEQESATENGNSDWGDQDRWPLVRTSRRSAPFPRLVSGFNRARSRSIARLRRILSPSR